jgi:hypothetical protein
MRVNRARNNGLGLRHDNFALMACAEKDRAARRDDNGCPVH